MRRTLTFILTIVLVVSAFTVNVYGNNRSEKNVTKYAMVVLPVSAPVDARQSNVKNIISANVSATLSMRISQLDQLFDDFEFRFSTDYLFAGLSFSSSQETLTKIEKLDWIGEIFELGSYEPTGDISTAEMVSAGSVYDLNDVNDTSINGTGIVIGVIDSGVDYNHKHLGGGILGNSGKVIGGKNFVENGEEPIDDTPICHGTSVAGLIAGSRDSFSIAPSAKLMSYRVYSNKSPRVREDVVVRAINQAVKDGCNIINISLSEPGGSSSTPSIAGKAVKKAIESGVVVVGSGGDYGSYCNYSDKGTVGGAALVPDAICVGAMDSRAGFLINIVETNISIPAMASIPFSEFIVEHKKSLVDGGYGSEEDLSSIRLRGKIVLIKRGPSTGKSIPFYKKMMNAKRKGAIGMICWNDYAGELIRMQVGYDFELGTEIRSKNALPTCFISNRDGELLSRLIKEADVSLTISETNFNALARTTSLGPTEDLVFKPDLCAPGVGLYAPISLSPGSSDTPYTTSFSGTSASTAVVSGAVALLKQLYPDRTPAQIKLALMNTATLVRNDINGEPSSLLIQGAGRINIDSAVRTPALISPGGVIAKAGEKQTITLEGLNSDTTFKINIEVPDSLADAVEFDISSESVTVSSGETTTIDITPYFNPAKVPCNIECVIWFESGDIKLHVPIVCWKGFSSAERANITGLVVKGDKIDYNSSDNSEISIGYNVAMGDLYSYKPFAYGDYYKSDEATDTNQTVLSRCQVDLVDGNNDTWVTIRQCENVEYGHYNFSWDGKLDVSDDEYVPDGKYKIKLTRSESRVSLGGTENVVFSESVVAEQPIIIQGSSAKTPPKFRLYSRPSVPSVDQKFAIDLYITFARDVSSISLDLTYPTDEMEILDVISGDFMGMDGIAVQHDMFNEEEEGRIRIFSKRLGEKGIDGHGLVARVIAKCSDDVSPTVGYNNKRILNSDGYPIRHMSFPLELDITEDKPFAGDINFDGVVDVIDLVLFARTFGLTTKHPDYNIVADLNDDGMVDKKDLKILIANFGKRR